LHVVDFLGTCTALSPETQLYRAKRCSRSRTATTMPSACSANQSDEYCECLRLRAQMAGSARDV